jgi:UDP-glucose 4-epimerase
VRVLITGGSGFLGLHLGRRLADRGHGVTLFDLAPPDSAGSSSVGIPADLVEGDIADYDLVRSVIDQRKVEAVIHLAALLTDPCARDPVLGTQVNCLGAAAVFRASAETGVRKVVYGSSVAVFRPSNVPPDDADPPVNPPSIYGATKLFAENLAQVIAKAHPQTMLTGLRFGWVYGPGRTRGWNILQEVVESFALERETVHYPDYQSKNDWTYVEDAARAVEACLDAGRLSMPIYNIPGDYRGIWEAVAHLQRRFPRVKAQPFPAELPPSAWNFTSSNIHNDTGYRPLVMLEDGLDRMAAWISTNHGLKQS